MEETVKFLFEMGQLKKVRRSGWWIAGVNNPESVAEHSYRTAIIGYILAKTEGADVKKTVLMCLFHDIPESRLNDLHRIGRNYIEFETYNEIVFFFDQMDRLPNSISDELNQLFSELSTKKTIEGQLAFEADKLECLIQAREYQVLGYSDVVNWITNCQNALKTVTAKKIAEICINKKPNEWWIDIEDILCK